MAEESAMYIKLKVVDEHFDDSPKESIRIPHNCSQEILEHQQSISTDNLDCKDHKEGHLQHQKEDRKIHTGFERDENMAMFLVDNEAENNKDTNKWPHDSQGALNLSCDFNEPLDNEVQEKGDKQGTEAKQLSSDKNQDPCALNKSSMEEEIQNAVEDDSHVMLDSHQQQNLICNSGDTFSKVSDGNEMETCGIVSKVTDITDIKCRTNMKLRKSLKGEICKICIKGFSTKFEMDEHLASHKETITNEHINKDFQQRTKSKLKKKSDASQQKLFSKADLNKHCDNIHEEKKHLCDTCGVRYKAIIDLRIHLANKHGDKRFVGLLNKFKCPYCPLTSYKQSRMTAHLKTHTDEKNYTCKDCGAKYKWGHSLKEHMLIHVTNDSKKCHLCGLQFEANSELKLHLSKEAGDGVHFSHPKGHRCTICEKVFTTNHHLKRHQSTHSDKRPYECDICGSGFKQPTHLKAHMRTHQKILLGVQSQVK